MRAVLEAQFAYERMGAARSLCIHILAVVGVLVWLEAIWPDWLSPDVRFFTLALWGGALFVACWTAVEEYVWHRRVRQYLAAKDGVTLSDTANDKDL